MTNGAGVWNGDKIGAPLEFRLQNGQNGSLASSLASLDLPLRDHDDVDDDENDHNGEEGPFVDPESEAGAPLFEVGSLSAFPVPLTPPTEFSLTHMTAPMVDAVVDDFEKTGDPAFLFNSVRTVFRFDPVLIFL